MIRYDAVLIAGGGVREGGRLPPWVAARFELALRVCGPALLMPLSAGTVHRPPPVDDKGFPISEAWAGARYLIQRGVDPSRIVIESSSLDTIGDAYFSRAAHVIPRGFTRVLVITSEFHLERTKAVFTWVYSLKGPGESCVVDFAGAADVGVDPSALSARLEKERVSLENLASVQARISSLAQLHEWLFAEHAGYAANEQRVMTEVDTGTY